MCSKGKHQVQDVISIELKVQNIAYAELEGTITGFKLHGVWLVLRKAILITDFRLGKVKVKSRNDQACSLFSLSSLFSVKGKRKTHSSFFLFSATRVSSKYFEHSCTTSYTSFREKYNT